MGCLRSERREDGRQREESMPCPGKQTPPGLPSTLNKGCFDYIERALKWLSVLGRACVRSPYIRCYRNAVVLLQ